MPIINDLLQNNSLDQSLSAYHWNRDKVAQNNLNESNPGFGIEHQDGDMRYMLGQYLNSYRNNSNYALVGYTPLQSNTEAGKFSAGIIGGAMTGYKDAPIVPVAGLIGAYDNKDFGINLLAVPNIKAGGLDADGFLGIQTKFKIK